MQVLTSHTRNISELVTGRKFSLNKKFTFTLSREDLDFERQLMVLDSEGGREG